MSDSPDPRKPRYEWVPTFPDKELDWVGWDGDVRFGRVYKHHLGGWWWFLNGQGLGSANGENDTARQAILLLEQEYDRVKTLLIEQGRFNKIPRSPRQN